MRGVRDIVSAVRMWLGQRLFVGLCIYVSGSGTLEYSRMGKWGFYIVYIVELHKSIELHEQEKSHKIQMWPFIRNQKMDRMLLQHL